MFRFLGCQTALSLVPLCIVVHEVFCASELTMNIERMQEWSIESPNTSLSSNAL